MTEPKKSVAVAGFGARIGFLPTSDQFRRRCLGRSIRIEASPIVLPTQEGDFSKPKLHAVMGKRIYPFEAPRL